MFVSLERSMQEPVDGSGMGSFGSHDRDVNVQKIQFCKKNNRDKEILNK